MANKIDFNTNADTFDSVKCSRCGQSFRVRPLGENFHRCYSKNYRGTGHLPFCKSCTRQMFKDQLLRFCQSCEEATRDDLELAIKRFCARTDVYYDKRVSTEACNRGTFENVIDCYLESLSRKISKHGLSFSEVVEDSLVNKNPVVDNSDVPDNLIKFWGSGYNPSVYGDLESRFDYHCEKLKVKRKNLDLGTELLLKQICILELSINKDIAAGKSVDKAVNSLNTLVGSLNLKPVQTKQDDNNSELANIPLGVWILKYENERPLPDIDPELKDCNKIKKYFFTWLGSVCKMLGKKNSFSKLYEDEIQKIRAENPELSEKEDDDDEFYADMLEEDLEDLEI